MPQKPIKPDLKKLIPIILILAFGSGFGLAFALDFLSNNFYDPDDVKKAFNLPVLACIPALLTDEELRNKRVKELTYAAIAASGYVTAAVLLIVLLKKGPGAFSGIL